MLRQRRQRLAPAVPVADAQGALHAPLSDEAVRGGNVGSATTSVEPGALPRARRDGQPCQSNNQGATQRARRQLPRIFTLSSRALDAIFTPALLNWRVDKGRYAARGGRHVNRCALCE